VPKNITVFASESVCAGHPDKIADQISDAILDALLEQDPTSRVAIETLVASDRIILAGEVTTTAKVDFEAIARHKIKELGYINPKWGFGYNSRLEQMVHEQSPEIAAGVDLDGAGDQGMMFGYACQDTPDFMPLPITLAHGLARALDESKKAKLPYLRPDGKAQVVVEYQNGKPVSVKHVTIAVPHDEAVLLHKVREDVYEEVVKPVLHKFGHSIDFENVLVNGTGVWHHPGPFSDSGLTGRKIVVDSYGGIGRVGGGAFSGKDPSKVDRSGAYAARYIAKNIVAAGLAAEVEVELAYYIGAKEPVMMAINTFGNGHAPQAQIDDYAHRLLIPSVRNIIETLNLRRPIYSQTAVYGHFGKPNLPWEKIVS